MIDRIAQRHALQQGRGVPLIVLAMCLVGAAAPAFAAAGLIGEPIAMAESPAGTALVASEGAVVVQQAVDDSTSPVASAAAAGKQRQQLAAVAAIERAKQQKKAAKRAVQAAAAGGTGSIPVAGSSAKQRQIHALVVKYFPKDQVGNAMAVAACESGQSDAIGATNSDGTTDWGVFQLNDGGTLQSSLSAVGVSYGSTAEAQKLALNTAINVKAAASIYAGRSWAPWVCAYKISVVAALYSSTPGPMAGKFDTWGRPTVPVPIVNIGPSGSGDKTEVPTGKQPANQGTNGTTGTTKNKPAKPKTTASPRPSSLPTAPTPSGPAASPATANPAPTVSSPPVTKAPAPTAPAPGTTAPAH